MKRAAGPGIPVLAALVSLVLLLAGLTVFPPRSGLDTHRFVEFGQSLVDAYRGECPAADCAIGADPMYPGYIVSSLYLRSISAAFPGSALLAATVFNALFFAAVAFIMFNAWQRLVPVSGERPFAVLAIGLYVLFGLPDVALWSYWMLSESLFLFVVSGCVYWVIRAMLFATPTAWSAAFVFAACGFFVRPTGIVLVPLVLAAFFLSADDRADRSRALRRFAAFVAAGLVATFVVAPLVVYLVLSGSDMFAALPVFLERLVRQAAWFFSEGWIVADQPATYVEKPETVFDIVFISLRRVAYYYLPVKSSFSLLHNVINAVYLVVAAGAGVLGFRTLYRGNDRTASIALWLVLVALCYGLLHALTIVSYEWRYQVPAMVPVWIFAGVGLLTCLGRGQEDDVARANGSSCRSRD